MREISSTAFKRQFGEWLDQSRNEPITVNKAGTPVAVVMSAAEYEHLQAMEDFYWVDRAQAAEATGEWVSHDTAFRLLAGRLK
jgi:prevent-host-death family protein